MAPRFLRIGTAGWAIPRAVADRFPEGSSGLQRYATRLDAAEINSTFYRPHRPSTFARWRETTPPDFRFAVKLARAITHDARLIACEPIFAAFLAQLSPLGEKLGPILVQLPPSLTFEPATAEAFFAGVRRQYDGEVVCEPRHASWFEPAADELLVASRVARAAADPARDPRAATPGGWSGLAYWRMHGSPRMYYSAYDAPALDALAGAIRACPAECAWCVFDNTTSGAAAANALDLAARLR